MKRSDFLKSLSALPLGVFAGNELVKSIGTKPDTPPVSGESTIDVSGLNDTPTLDGALNESIHRVDLVEPFIKRAGGNVGRTKLYAYTSAPTFQYKHQGNDILSIGDTEFNRPKTLGGPVTKDQAAVKTTKAVSTVHAIKYTGAHILRALYDDLTERCRIKNDPTVFVLHSVMLTPAIYNAQDYEAVRSVLFRGAFITF